MLPMRLSPRGRGVVPSRCNVVLTAVVGLVPLLLLFTTVSCSPVGDSSIGPALVGTMTVYTSAVPGVSTTASALASPGFFPLPSTVSAGVAASSGGVLLVTIPSDNKTVYLNVTSALKISANESFVFSLAVATDGFAFDVGGGLSADSTLFATGTTNDIQAGAGTGVLFASWSPDLLSLMLDLTFAYAQGVVEKESFVLAAVQTAEYTALATTFKAAADGGATKWTL
eukprot:TRINITY_DN9835_c0_g1_i1.p1 TRINITY_DN9835_c0_g1~~TRINITY_DN9835_c0_g1_i1.p1  ORF type:complete len:227 (+),score=57.08 TRINITY_DN9835_c0_g1_i1:113-793(+)